jgi:hypothetical protein
MRILLTGGAGFIGRHVIDALCGSGNVTDEAIAEYIRLQGAEPENDDHFQVSEWRACIRDSTRPFSRLQSTKNPSPSGEGRSNEPALFAKPVPQTRVMIGRGV